MLKLTLNQKFIATYSVGSSLKTSICGLSSQWLTGALLLGLSMNLLSGQQAQALSFNFSNIVNTNTFAPGTSTRFTSFDYSNVEGGYVAFRGFTSSNLSDVGIYVSGNNTLTKVVDKNTLIPQGVTSTSKFTSPKFFTNQGGTVALFSNEPSADAGIYSYSSSGNSRSLVADRSTLIPNGVGNFSNFGFQNAPQLVNNAITFTAFGANSQSGIYRSQNNALSRIVDRNNLIPDGSGSFTNFVDFEVNGSNTVFVAQGANGQYGVYSSIGGVLSTIANTNTLIAGGTSNFARFLKVVVDNNNNTFFTGFASGGETGLYSSSNGNLSLIASQSTNGLTSFSQFAAINNSIFFTATNTNLNNQRGLYTNLGGSITKIIGIGDVLDRKTVSQISFNNNGVTQDFLTFIAAFSDGSQGVYLAQALLPSLNLQSASISSLSPSSAQAPLGALSLSASGLRTPQTQSVPEPLTLLGAATAIGFGAFFKKKINKK